MSRRDEGGRRPVLRRLLTWLLLVGGGGAAAGEASIRERLAAASPERGQTAFLVCRPCHDVDERGTHSLGPNLRGVIDRPLASAEGYTDYSLAMMSFGGTWTVERLDRYLHHPTTEVEGTSMVFPGVPDADDRADIIAWLGLISGLPSFAEGSRIASAANAGSAHEPVEANYGILVPAEGADAAHAYCTVCHSERIVAQQGLTRNGWQEVLEFMTDEYGMPPIGAPDFDRVINYLSTHYGPDRPNFPLE